MAFPAAEYIGMIHLGSYSFPEGLLRGTSLSPIDVQAGTVGIENREVRAPGGQRRIGLALRTQRSALRFAIDGVVGAETEMRARRGIPQKKAPL